jgi:hypothetical protein
VRITLKRLKGKTKESRTLKLITGSEPPGDKLSNDQDLTSHVILLINNRYVEVPDFESVRILP